MSVSEIELLFSVSSPLLTHVSIENTDDEDESKESWLIWGDGVVFHKNSKYWLF